MFHQLISSKRDEWFASPECTVNDLMAYILRTGKMRDAQVNAIKTYLFLKIACGGRPLWELFSEGVFNSLDLDSLELSTSAREILTSNKGAAALLEYAMLKDRKGRQLGTELERFIKLHADEIDYEAVFKKIFYEVDYTDYIFSLPMGAGKTYLMAAFIYLDLYFAQNEPDNPCFAHNFMILAPSGLKSSIVPSLKNIREFEPSWILPEPAASLLKSLIKFEILDEQKSASQSNIIKNPNAQKINIHQPLESLMGLVAITNAEKVILDRMETNTENGLFSKEEMKRIHQANELRTIIGKIPHLSIFIDEVHHAAKDDILLRKVVNGWAKGNSFNAVLGFSGTPYLEKPECVVLGEGLSIKSTDLSNVVYHYPLIDGIGNFLKVPMVRHAEGDTEMIVGNGVRDFLDSYKDTVYANGTCAKLAIYCGQIETLEEKIFPLVSEIASEYGLDPTTSILKFHKGNTEHPCSNAASTDFESLDTSISKIRIVLLVQIGKEGWDCKSLTGVILPQRGVCPTNMVLQTSCRCLRQVEKNAEETALIWMNAFNADTLNKQLKQRQDITLQEFANQPQRPQVRIERHSRMEHLKVPPIDFFQLKVSYQTLVIDERSDARQNLEDKTLLQKANLAIIEEQDLEGNILKKDIEQLGDTEYAGFNAWLHCIVKESFNTLTIAGLKACEPQLRSIFERITVEREGKRFFNHFYDHRQIRSNIRQAFAPKRDFKAKEEIIPMSAELLQIEKFKPSILVDAQKTKDFYPSQSEVGEVLAWDAQPQPARPAPEVMALIRQLEALGQDTSSLYPKNDPHPERAYTYHYLPYRFDSPFERKFFSLSALPFIKDKALEVYFNGDDTLTDFKIDCFKQNDKGHWLYIGKYVPDFLLLRRNAEGAIHKVIIIETKGEGFAAKFADRKRFMETEFVKKNNEHFGYERFDFLYLEDTLSQKQRDQKTAEAINNFFKD